MISSQSSMGVRIFVQLLLCCMRQLYATYIILFIKYPFYALSILHKDFIFNKGRSERCLLSWGKTLSAIFTGAQTTFYYLILCTAAGAGNCNIDVLIYASVRCSDHNIISFSVYLDIPDISPRNNFFQLFHCTFPKFLPLFALIFSPL